MTGTNDDAVAAMIEAAEAVSSPAAGPAAGEDLAKPRLLVESAAPDRTIAALRDLLAGTGEFYDRGVPVRLAFDQSQDGMMAQLLTPDVLVLMAHRFCRPYALKEKKSEIIEVDVRLPRQFAVMYLDWRGEWRLPPLNGIASAPLLDDSGNIHATVGYDAPTGIWCERIPDLASFVPDRPTRGDAEAALVVLRDTFRTFCFADAAMVEKDGVALVDLDQAPGMDESAFLTALLTAVCRPSLPLAPGILVRAASVSGAGAGKGLLARCMAIIAFGREPHAVTGGSNHEEMEKRISAELMGGSPMLFLDNLNNFAVRSDLLASAITERPARIRVLGRSQMVPLNASVFVALTGNGLTVSEDLARRFITIELDPRTEDPEARRFPNDIKAHVWRERRKLLAAAVTIWRWGRCHDDLPAGRAIGSFETWSRWVRDPLMMLGCRDPVERFGDAKAHDTRRQTTAELFRAWWDHHGNRPMVLRELDEHIVRLADPQGRGRQYLAAQFGKLAGTRIAGLILNRQPTVGHWSAATYRMERTDDPEKHRDHRGHRDHPKEVPPYDPYAKPASPTHGNSSGTPMTPMTPMIPMPSAAAGKSDTGDWTEEIP
jgi:hypothetical protein